MVSQEDFFAEPARDESAPAYMEPHSALLLSRATEIIWSAEHARDRSKQRVPGPSELGSECERKLAYSSLGRSPVNHTADHHQAFVGTAVHAALAEAYEKADNGAGRYLIEHKVSMATPEGIIVSGSLDIYDRVTGEVIDWKLPGSRSRKKYARTGPPQGYRIQAHLYAYGLEQAGESPKRVANIYLPPEGKLSETFCWSEPYNKNIALQALANFERITGIVQGDPDRVKLVPKTITPLCHWCSAWLKNSPDTAIACQGGDGDN